MMSLRRQDIQLLLSSESETSRFGHGLAAILKNRDLVTLSGPLGAGKTCLIKGIALGLGVAEDDIKSPSFVLVNEYRGRLPIYHLDLYRMKDVGELYQIGWDDYLDRDGIILVEWGEKAAALLPSKRIEIGIEIVSENERRLSMNFRGESKES